MKYIIITLGCFSLISTLICITLLIKFLRLKSIIKHLSVAYSQIETIVSNSKNNTSDNDVHQENFIKFLSESRDWAYGYIDSVQKTIDGIIQKTDKTVQYHKDFKSLEIEPYATHISVLADAVEELKTLLPAKEKE